MSRLLPRTVEVTEMHIRMGTARSCNWCPIALAIMDAFPGVRTVTVEGGEIDVLFRDGSGMCFYTTPECEDFIYQVDEPGSNPEDPPQPFTFELDEVSGNGRD